MLTDDSNDAQELLHHHSLQRCAAANDYCVRASNTEQYLRLHWLKQMPAAVKHASSPDSSMKRCIALRKQHARVCCPVIDEMETDA